MGLDRDLRQTVNPIIDFFFKFCFSAKAVCLLFKVAFQALEIFEITFFILSELITEVQG